ncbi:unnamed protein product [[Candida] boidinii]|nr:hypothetical protein B5S30_g561 [[Candida] boidinii]GMF53085.1 unnamed protein product [[Candida] boidinii]
MSLRALKRLERLKNQELLNNSKTGIREDDSEIDEESDHEATKISKKTGGFNAFALLNDDEESEDEEESPDEHKDTLFSEDNIKIVSDDDEFNKKAEIKQSQTKNNKIKKNKKKKGKNSKKESDKPEEDLDSDAELDKFLQQVRLRDENLMKKDEDEEVTDGEYIFDEIEGPMDIYLPGGKFFTISKFKKSLPLLQFNAADLDPEKEFQNLFGKLSSSAIEDADSTSSTFITPEILKQIKQMSKKVRGWAGRDRRSIPGTSRKLTLTKIRDDWIPTTQKSLMMEELSSSELQALFESQTQDWKDVIREDIIKETNFGVRYFKMVEGHHSRLVNTQFYISVVIQPNHEALIQLLQRSPYHLESLLQVASILQRQGDNTNTNGLVERALFVIDWSLKPTFTFGSGLCRLPFEYYFNRQVYLAIFRYISILTQKNTFFTALNACKLLLSFCPADDPYGVRYFIDFYAIHSEEYQYLIELVKSPLVKSYKEWYTPSLAYSVSLAYLRLNKLPEAQKSLKEAFRAHPYTAYLLLESVGLGTSEWTKGEVSTSVQLATALYVARTKTLWNDQEAIDFLNFELIPLIRSEEKDISTGDFHLMNLTEIPRNLLRLVILSNETSAMAKLPADFWDENEIFEFDVLPPKNGDSILDYIDQNRVGDAIINNSMDAEEERQIEELLRQTALQEQ